MDFLDIFNALNYKNLNNENLQLQMEKLLELVNINFKEIIESSFKKGYEEGEKCGRSNENLIIRGKITGNLFSNSDLTNEEIFNIVGFGEEKWEKDIPYFREQYENAKKNSMLDSTMEDLN